MNDRLTETPLLFCEQIRQIAERSADKIFVRDEHRALSYRDVSRTIDSVATQLRDAGVAPGERCIVLMENGIAYALVWLALARIGATSVLLNQAYKGAMLARHLNGVGARAVVTDADHLQTIIDIAEPTPPFDCVFVVGDMQTRIHAADLPTRPLDVFGAPSADDGTVQFPLPRLSDVMSIFYTSGTTGASKGVAYTHMQAWQTAQTVARYLDDSDVFYMTNPMCHVSLPHCLGAALFCGGTLAVRARYSSRAFWPDVRHFGATVTMMLGSVASFVAGAPTAADDRDHTLRKVLMVPLLKDVREFCDRFNVGVMSWFNMTELSVPLHTDGFSRTPGQDCGRPRPGAVARIVDELDVELPDGVAGELVIRDERPWAISPGYVDNSSATLASWRNQWFHTGDLFVRRPTGEFVFVDRMKDRIRRRGENVSSFEVEAEISTHPAVREVAVVGVKAADGEDEVRAVIVLKDGASLSADALLDYLQPRMPHFFLPRYVSIRAEALPKTPTGKVMKNVLKATPNDADWDREQVGYEVKR